MSEMPLSKAKLAEIDKRTRQFREELIEEAERGVSEMAARVADAMSQVLGDEIDFDVLARAAIAAMREPTEAMLDASYGLAGSERGDARAEAAVWAAMIDAALKAE